MSLTPWILILSSATNLVNKLHMLGTCQYSRSGCRWASLYLKFKLPYFFSCKTEVYMFQNNPKDLDPSCKTDLDPCDCLGRVKKVKIKVSHSLIAVGAVGVRVPLYLGHSWWKAEPIPLFCCFILGIIGIIAKFHRTDLDIWSHSRGTNTPSYSRINSYFVTASCKYWNCQVIEYRHWKWIAFNIATNLVQNSYFFFCDFK